MQARPKDRTTTESRPDVISPVDTEEGLEPVLGAQAKGNQEIGQVVPNFRIYAGDGQYTEFSVLAELGGRLPLVFSMTSIRNSHFTTLSSLKYMMKETAVTFGENGNKVFCFDSSYLQRHTNPSVFDEKHKNLNIKATDLYRRKFDESKTALRRENISLPFKTVMWKEHLLDQPDYQPIYQFVLALMQPQKALQENFSDVPCKTDVLDRLRQSIDNAGLPALLKDVADTYILHDRDLKKVFDSGKELAVYEAVRCYQAEEFSVFLLVAFWSSSGEINEKFKVFLPDQTIMPLLSYPISASKKELADGRIDILAEKTFTVFIKIQQLYQAYAEELSLPVIKQAITVVDALIPENYRPVKKQSDRARREKGRSLSSSSGSLIFSADSEPEVRDVAKPDGNERTYSSVPVASASKASPTGVYNDSEFRMFAARSPSSPLLPDFFRSRANSVMLGGGSSPLPPLSPARGEGSPINTTGTVNPRAKWGETAQLPFPKFEGQPKSNPQALLSGGGSPFAPPNSVKNDGLKGESEALVLSKVGIFPKQLSETTALRILSAIEDYVAEGCEATDVEENEIYRNGVTCTLVPLEKTGDNATDNKQRILNMISKTVKRVVESDEPEVQERIKFRYLGWRYQLAIISTKPALVAMVK